MNGVYTIGYAKTRIYSRIEIMRFFCVLENIYPWIIISYLRNNVNLYITNGINLWGKNIYFYNFHGHTEISVTETYLSFIHR